MHIYKSWFLNKHYMKTTESVHASVVEYISTNINNISPFKTNRTSKAHYNI